VTGVVMLAHDETPATLEQQRTRRVLDAVSDTLAVIEFSPEGTIREANDNFLDLLGYGIEEVRGRQSGKGFAVVASEVKDLAKQTALATNDIQRWISGIQ